MIKSSVYRTNLILLAAILVASLSLGVLINVLIVNYQKPETPSPARFLSNYVCKDGFENREKRLAELNQLMYGALPFQLALYDENAKFLTGHALPDDIPITKSHHLPKQELELLSIQPERFGPPGFDADSIIRLPGEPAQYLRVTMTTSSGSNPAHLIRLSAVILFGSIFLGAGFALYVIFIVLRSKVRDVDQVLSRLQAGDLKARLNVKRMDEIGQTMTRFNLMADEIERLVESLRESEAARNLMIQELAHDLRTPIASLKNLIELLSSKAHLLPDEKKSEALNLASIEINYFAKLVEDLLFMAQVSEPKYQVRPNRVPVAEILNDVSASSDFQNKIEERPIEMRLTGVSASLSVAGDPYLLKRMFKNIIGNAFSFAHSRVEVQCKKEGQFILVHILDDGPGFSSDALDHFGKRRHTRTLDHRRGGRVSTGLGSVISVKVAELHRGSIVVKNRGADENPIGTDVCIRLPIN